MQARYLESESPGAGCSGALSSARAGRQSICRLTAGCPPVTHGLSGVFREANRHLDFAVARWLLVSAHGNLASSIKEGGRARFHGRCRRRSSNGQMAKYVAKGSRYLSAGRSCPGLPVLARWGVENSDVSRAEFERGVPQARHPRRATPATLTSPRKETKTYGAILKWVAHEFVPPISNVSTTSSKTCEYSS